MSLRLTVPAKWKDPWFKGLSDQAKVLFLYIVDICDESGCLEIDIPRFCEDLGWGESMIRANLNKIRKCYEVSNDKTFIFIKKYLFYQNKLPLNKRNNDHKMIISMMKDRVGKFSNASSFISILENITSEAYTKPARYRQKAESFEPPSREDIRKFLNDEGIGVHMEEGEKFLKHYTNNGWLVGKQKAPMVNWKTALKNWMSKYAFNRVKKFRRPLDSIKDAHKEIRTQ